MKSVGHLIKETREARGMTQQELADQTQLSTRTIQRIENNETQARAFTIKRIAEVLDIELNNVRSVNSSLNIWSGIINIVGCIIVNIAFVIIFGYLILDSNANVNSTFGALSLAVCLPFFVHYFTGNMRKMKRFVMFSVGLWLYVLILLIFHGFIVLVSTPLVYTVIIYSIFLYNINTLMFKRVHGY